MTRTPTRTQTLAQLITHAHALHASITGTEAIGQAALAKAFDAGAALIAIKARVARGEWSATLAKTGIPSSTARLYMRLAAHRDQITAAGCKSIREARTLLTDRKPPRRRSTRARASATEPESDRYEEGYAAGYVKGRIDERNAHAAETHTDRNGRNGWTPAPADLKWMLKRVHPDHADEKDKLKATRAAQWLNQLLEAARR